MRLTGCRCPQLSDERMPNKTCHRCRNDYDEAVFAIRKNGNRNAYCPPCLQYIKDRGKAGRSYDSRDAELRRIGFDSYRDYLRSDLWRAVREKVFEAKGRACHLCGGVANQVHHNRYHANDLTGKRLAYLNPVCDSCHRKIEFRRGLKIGHLSAVKRKYTKRRKRRLKGLRH